MGDLTQLSIKLDKSIRIMLEDKGFKHKLTRQGGDELRLEFERIIPDSAIPQRVVLSGNFEPPDRAIWYHIYVEVYSHKEGVYLLTLKELHPDYRSLEPLNHIRWTYTTEDEQEECLAEIRSLIEEKLFDWFDNPVFNPSKQA